MKDRIGQGRLRASQLTLEALSDVIRREEIERCLRETGRQGVRLRKLPAFGVVWLVIGIGLFADGDLPTIWRQVEGTLARLWQVMAGIKPAGKSAIVAARRRLGARVMRLLFKSVSSTVADDRTRGAFYRGHRLMAMDGQKLCVPDTPANARAFGRPSTRRYGEAVRGGYPQLLLMRLIETGTHVTVEALIKPCRKGEYPLAGALLRHAPRGSLVMQDRGFYGYSQFQQAMAQGVELLGRVGAHVVFEPVRSLDDGSTLVCIYPTHKDRRRQTRGRIVRLIRYTIDDPARPGHRQEHRLATTLLDDKIYPARELVELYHQRWEIEIDNDELATHQLNRPVELRSRTPAGVVQELYGILLAHNAIRMLMHESARCIDIDPRRLSFIHAVRVIRETIPLMRAAPVAQLPCLYQAMLAHIAHGRLPPREDRINPRVVKVKMSNYAKKQTGDRGTWVKPFGSTVVMLK
jgi:hypothetical protein